MDEKNSSDKCSETLKPDKENYFYTGKGAHSSHAPFLTELHNKIHPFLSVGDCIKYIYVEA